jgi:hypothetical protein
MTGFFYMPQICDTGRTALLPLRRKACCGFFRLKNLTASAGFKPAFLGARGQHANHHTTEAAQCKNYYGTHFILLTRHRNKKWQGYTPDTSHHCLTQHKMPDKYTSVPSTQHAT